MPNRFTAEILSCNLVEMERLRDGALAGERALAGAIEHVHPEWRTSARNLAHYLALRNSDLRDLQRPLAALGLSSLGRAEAHTLASIEAVLAALARMAVRPGLPRLDLPVDFSGGPARLEAHTRALLGPPAAGRRPASRAPARSPAGSTRRRSKEPAPARPRWSRAARAGS